MSGGYGPQSSYRGMSVPETIQLSTEADNNTVGQPRPSQYRPMQVPDRITLDEASSTVTSPANNEDAWQQRIEPLTSDVKTKEVTSTQIRFLPNTSQNLEPNSDDSEVALKLSSLERRVSTLESQVRSIRPSGPSRFWYVMSFSAWMMLPLAVVFMFYYRRNSP